MNTNEHESGKGLEDFVPEEMQGRRRYLRPVKPQRRRAKSRPQLIVGMVLLGVLAGDWLLGWGLPDWMKLFLVIVAAAGVVWRQRGKAEG